MLLSLTRSLCTLAQVGRGGGPVQHQQGEHGGEGRPWYNGFNLSRKFY